MKHAVIVRDERIYASHASACQAGNGDILVAFRQAPFEHIFAHVHPEAKVGLVRSTDMGETWDYSSRTIALDPGHETNLNDPSLTTLSDGTIILTAFVTPCPRSGNEGKWGDQAMPVRGNDYFYVAGERAILISRSFDHGRTWDGPYEVDTSAYGHGTAGVFASVVELSDGTLLMPITETAHDKSKHVSALLASRDKGKTWEPYSVVTSWTDSDPSHCFGLPSVIAYDDDHMVAAGWTIAEHGTLVTRSDDGGMTWSEPETVNTRGACMHLCLTHSGTTIMSYGYRVEPYGIRLLPSYDRGRTWDMNLACALRSDGAMRDLGYPWTIQLNDGRLLCVYYFNVADEDKSYYDKQASLELCRQWNLDPPLYTYETAGLRFIGGTFLTEDDLRDLAGNAQVVPEGADEGPTLL